MCIMEVTEGEDTGRKKKKKKNTGWKLPKLYEKHHGSKKLHELLIGKSHKSTPRHIILKLLKDGEHFGSIRKKWHFMYRRTTVRLMIGFSSDVREVKVSGIFCAHRKNNCPLIILPLAKASFTNEGKWKHFQINNLWL